MATLGQILATTHRFIRPRVVDQVLTGTPLTERMKVEGLIRRRGGRNITLPILKALPSGGSYVGLETFNATDNDEPDGVTFEWMQNRATPAMSGIDYFKNSGEAEAISIWRTKMDAAAMRINEDGTAAMFADPTTADITRDLTPLEQILDTGNTYTVGGMTSDDVANWQGNVEDGGGDALTLLDVENGYLDSSEGKIHPSDIIFSKTGYGKFWSLVQINQRYGPGDKRVGFKNFEFDDAIVYWDSHILTTGGNYTGQRAYVLNLNHLYLVIGEGADFTIEEKDPVDADGYAALVKVYWQLCCDARRFQGAIHNFLVT